MEVLLENSTAPETGTMEFSFGQPERLLKDTWLTDIAGVRLDSTYDVYEPPVPRELVYRTVTGNAYLGPVLIARRNMILNAINTNGKLNRRLLGAAIYNYLLYGDMGILKLRNRLGLVTAVQALSSHYLRRAPDGNFKYLQQGDDAGEIIAKPYRAEDIAFLSQYDPTQQIYGLPDWIGGLQSALLNTDATLFKRRYYINGAHMGYILYSSDAKLGDKDKAAIEQALAGSKGAGNFRNMFINIPDGKEKGIQVIPIGDFSSKDQFASAKNISAQDVLTANRFPSGMAGIIPQGTAGLGDPLKTDEVYQRNEALPMARDIVEFLNSDMELAKLGALRVIESVTKTI